MGHHECFLAVPAQQQKCTSTCLPTPAPEDSPGRCLASHVTSVEHPLPSGFSVAPKWAQVLRLETCPDCEPWVQGSTLGCPQPRATAGLRSHAVSPAAAQTKHGHSCTHLLKLDAHLKPISPSQGDGRPSQGYTKDGSVLQSLGPASCPVAHPGKDTHRVGLALSEPSCGPSTAPCMSHALTLVPRCSTTRTHEVATGAEHCVTSGVISSHSHHDCVGG